MNKVVSEASNKLTKPMFSPLHLLLIALLFLATASGLTLAWTPPSGTAPDGNVSAPINTGSATQLKTGALGIDNTLITYGTFFANHARIWGGGDNTFTSPGHLAIKSSATSPYISFHNSDGARIAFLQAVAGSRVRLTDELGAETLTLKSGNIGIGTAAPAAKLHVQDTVSSLPTGIKFTPFHVPGVVAGTQLQAADSNGTARVISLNPGGGGVSVGHTNGAQYEGLDVNGEVIADGWFRTRGNRGWYSQTYGGGWYMSDTTWIRAYGNKNVITGGLLRAEGGLCISSDCKSSWNEAAASGHSFTRSTTAGYADFPTGMIMQWGAISPGSDVSTFNFPRAFPNACLFMSISAGSPSDGNWGEINVESQCTSRTQATIKCRGQEQPCNWFAIGY